MTTYDVVIVGCGIAGTICGLKLIKEGYSVLIIDKASVPGGSINKKVDITEDAGLGEILTELDIDVLERSKQSYWFSEHQSFSFTSDISDLFVKRGSDEDSFDHILSTKVLDQGVDIEYSSSFKTFEFDSKKISKMAYLNKGINTVGSNVFVGADGTDSATRKKMQLDAFSYIGDDIIGYGTVVENLSLEEKKTYVYFDSELLPGGYFFAARISPALGVLSVVSTKSFIPSGALLKKYYERFVSTNDKINAALKECKNIQPFNGFCHTGILKKRYKKNFCLVGDAAYVIDPFFGYGVRQSILSGYTAAEEISSLLTGTNDSLHPYEERLMNMGLSNQGTSVVLRKIFEKLNNKDLDFIVQSVDSINNKHNLDDVLVNPKNYMGVFLWILLQHPWHITKLGLKATSSFLSARI
jgi:flavin-dependent dehydrogenase